MDTAKTLLVLEVKIVAIVNLCFWFVFIPINFGINFNWKYVIYKIGISLVKNVNDI